MKRIAGVVALLALATAACGSGPEETRTARGGAPTAASPAAEATEEATTRVDPRDDGFRIGFGEFAVSLEAPAIRPGPVSFVVRNGGQLDHGFEMEIEGRDSSGSGSGDGFKMETEIIPPGETIRFDLDLAPGVYKVECFVGNHDDRGMEALLEVRPDAPLLRVSSGSPDAVRIEGFAFAPARIEVAAGTEVTWTNADPAAHTVTARDGAFDSGSLDEGQDFTQAFDAAGTYRYLCSIHPTMKGTVVVG